MGFLNWLCNGGKHSIPAPSDPGRVRLTRWRSRCGEFYIFQEMWRKGFGLSTLKFSHEFTQVLLVLLGRIDAGPWTSYFTSLDSWPSIPFLGWFLLAHLQVNKCLNAIHVLGKKTGKKEQRTMVSVHKELTTEWGKQKWLILSHPEAFLMRPLAGWGSPVWRIPESEILREQVCVNILWDSRA